MKFRRITVMDPNLMKTNPINFDLHHEQPVMDLHRAVIACINQFFDGWSVDPDDWTF
jgi:hypothetical protein